VKILRQRIVRWGAVFRAPRPSDLILIYSGAAPGSGTAIRHSHPGNHRPHVHIQEHDDAHSHHHDESDHDHSHHHTREHFEQRSDEPDHSHAHREETKGHWHLAIPAHPVRGLHALLTLALSIVWLAISDSIAIFPARRFHAPARAPPSLA
jgi:hypothetical protein